MEGTHCIVVSAENNPYTGWQCKLFYFSCLTRLKQRPLIIVHDDRLELHRDFQDLIAVGCSIHRSPSFRTTRSGDDYYPRNTAGTLIQVAEICADRGQPIVLCDPDMIFINRPLFPEGLSGDFCSYMDFDRTFVASAKQTLGIHRSLSDKEKAVLCCGVPYVIPIKHARELGEAWLEAVDAFPPRRWEDIMYAFGLAVIELGLEINLTHLADHNYWPHERPRGSLIHYCYGDDTWNKRNYFTDEQAQKVWNPQIEAPEGTILGELLNQIREARDFYEDERFRVTH